MTREEDPLKQTPACELDRDNRVTQAAMKKPTPLELGYALGGDGDDMICFYLSEALDVPIEVFEKMLEQGDIVGIDMAMWCAAAIRDPSVFEDDVVAERVRETVRRLTGWKG